MNGTVIENVLVALELEKFVKLYFLLPLQIFHGRWSLGAPEQRQNIIFDVFYAISYYSRLPITRTFKGNRKQFELSGVLVMEGKII